MVSTEASRSSCLGSNPSGATNLKINDMNELLLEVLKVACNESLYAVQEVDKMIRANALENEQWFLDWQDKLNEISVK